MSCWVYVLLGRGGRHYVGITARLARRIREHNAGRTAADVGRGPFRLVYRERCGDHAEARKREKYLKSGVGRRWLREHLAGRDTDASERSDRGVAQSG